MRLTQNVLMGIWFLVGLNLLIAICSIWVFMRMTPAIEVIIERNERSLQACEQMLASMVIVSEDKSLNNTQYAMFKSALKRAQNNITESGEPELLKAITKDYSRAFQGDLSARQKTVTSILLLAKNNREAMIKADIKAKNLGHAGTWGIVFMAICIFLAGLIFIRGLTLNILKPLEEIYSVISAHQSGDLIRRCSGADLPKDIIYLFNGINEILDKYKTLK